MNELFEKEWLITNGLGGYASSTVSNANTRHYHGLLVASLTPPIGRKILVGKVEETIVVNGKSILLSTNFYPDLIYPHGIDYMSEFKAKPLPHWRYGYQNWQIEKSISMVAGSNTTLVHYKNTGKETFVLEVHPLYVYSDYHAIFRESSAFDFYTEFSPEYLKTHASKDSPALFTSWTSGVFVEDRSWYKNIHLPKSQQRGLSCHNDYYHIGYLKKELKPNEELLLCFSLDENRLQSSLDHLWEEQRRTASRKPSKSTAVFYNDLLRAGDQFLVHRASTQSTSIIAGYHWFADWGRDSMIAMRGLTIATGRKGISKSILTTFFKEIDRGMIPDRFPDKADVDPHYNAMDATFWLFIAVYEYFKRFGEVQFVKKHFKALEEILEHHIQGTRYNIHVTEEGFLYGGQEGVQLTWMDALVDEKVITPRIGCPVEVNALWYNALKIYVCFCKELQITVAQKYKDLIGKLEVNFPKMFTTDEGTLYDVIIPCESYDTSFRPNQLFAISLPFPLLDRDQQKTVFDAVRKKLYTPYGLRTLDVEDPNFIGQYTGGQWSRDHSYHQGTVWPFLLYEYYHCFFRIYGKSKKNRARVLKELNHLKDHFYHRDGLHCISEIFDGLNPGKGKGCIQQAWSVSALVKLYAEYKLYEDGEGEM